MNDLRFSLLQIEATEMLEGYRSRKVSAVSTNYCLY